MEAKLIENSVQTIACIVLRAVVVEILINAYNIYKLVKHNHVVINHLVIVQVAFLLIVLNI